MIDVTVVLRRLLRKLDWNAIDHPKTYYDENGCEYQIDITGMSLPSLKSIWNLIDYGDSVVQLPVRAVHSSSDSLN